MSFWERILSPQTARFVLALLALILAGGATFYLMSEQLDPDGEQAVIFAVGQLFALAMLAFGYYFGSTARGDDRPLDAKIVNTSAEPAQVTEVQP